LSTVETQNVGKLQNIVRTSPSIGYSGNEKIRPIENHVLSKSAQNGIIDLVLLLENDLTMCNSN
jgi:hypothetical protein